MTFARFRIQLIGILILLAGIVIRGGSTGARVRAAGPGASITSQSPERTEPAESSPPEPPGAAQADPGDCRHEHAQFQGEDDRDLGAADENEAAAFESPGPSPDPGATLQEPLATMPVPPPGPLGCTGVLLLSLECSTGRIEVRQAVRKDVIFRATRDEGSVRYTLLRHDGGELFHGTIEPPTVCGECPAQAGDHESGCVRIPHKAALYIKVPDLAEARRIVFHRDQGGRTVSLGISALR